MVRESRRQEKEKEESAREQRERDEHLTHVSPLDLSAKPMEASTWWVPDVHEAPQRRVNRTKWTLFRLRGGVGATRRSRQEFAVKKTNQNVSSGEDSSGGSSPVEIKSLSPGRIVPQLHINDEKEIEKKPRDRYRERDQKSIYLFLTRYKMIL